MLIYFLDSLTEYIVAVLELAAVRRTSGLGCGPYPPKISDRRTSKMANINAELRYL